MYAYLLPFQHDMDIILLPYKKTSKKVKKHITINGEKYQKIPKIFYTLKENSLRSMKNKVKEC